MKNNSFFEIFEEIKKHDNIIIVTHTSPDGDAVASATALSLGLSKYNIKSTILTEKIEDKYDIIPYTSVPLIYIDDEDKPIDSLDIKCDLFISVDCGAKDRFPALYNLFDGAKQRVNIDHHISNDYFADYNFVDVKASSTSQIIYNFLEFINSLSFDIATSLYAGIVFDTGGFMHSNTSKETFAIASKLLDFEIEHTEIYRRIMYSRTKEQNMATAFVLGNMQVLDNGVGYLTVGYEDFENAKLTSDAFDSCVNNIINTRSVDIAFTAMEKKQGTTKISLRAHDFDVNKVASAFGGGGHILASGCKIDKNAYEATKLILEEIDKNGRKTKF